MNWMYKINNIEGKMDHIIKDYLKANGITAKDFCKAMGMDTSHLQRIYHRKRYPSRELCAKIYRYTAGQIHPADLLEFEDKNVRKGLESWRMAK